MSKKIYLIRHGEAAMAFDKDPNPGLSEDGRNSAVNLVKELEGELDLSVFELVSSPMKRARETGMPLAEHLNKKFRIDDSFSEIPSEGVPLSERRGWLLDLISKPVSELGFAQQNWRTQIINQINALEDNTIIFTHFMVINCIVAWLKGADYLVSFKPGYCSVTVLEKDIDDLSIVKLGAEKETVIR